MILYYSNYLYKIRLLDGVEMEKVTVITKLPNGKKKESIEYTPTRRGSDIIELAMTVLFFYMN